MDKCNWLLDTNVLLFDVLTILIHHLVFQYPFSILSFTILCDTSVSSVKKINFKSKEKTILSQAAWLFFLILCLMDICFKRLIIYQSGITMNISNTWSVMVLSNLTYFFSVEKKLQKWYLSIRHVSIRHNYFFKD